MSRVVAEPVALILAERAVVAAVILTVEYSMKTLEASFRTSVKATLTP